MLTEGGGRWAGSHSVARASPKLAVLVLAQPLSARNAGISHRLAVMFCLVPGAQPLHRLLAVCQVRPDDFNLTSGVLVVVLLL